MQLFDVTTARGSMTQQAEPASVKPTPSFFGLAPDKVPTLFAVATSVLYVVGFLVVTSYMGSRGIHDLSLLSSKYVMAGGLFAISAAMYYFFVWKDIYSRAINGTKLPANWSVGFKAFVIVYFVIHDFFGCCFFVAWLVTLTVAGVPGIILQTGTGLIYVIDRSIFMFFPARYGKTKFVLSSILLFLALICFLVWAAKYPPCLAAFGISVGFSFISSVVLNSHNWQEGKDKHYNVFYLCMSAVIAAIAFGSTVYGYCSPRFGGGQPAKVILVLSKEAESSITNEITEAGKDVYLISNGGDSVVLELGNDPTLSKTIQIDRKLVHSITLDRETKKDFIAAYVTDEIMKVVPTKASAAASSASQPLTVAPVSTVQNPVL